MDEILKAVAAAQAAIAEAAAKGDETAKGLTSKYDDLLKRVETMATEGKATRDELNGVLKSVAELLNPNRPGNGIVVAKTLGEALVTADIFKATDFGNANAMARVDVGFILKAITTNATAVPDKTRMSGIMPIGPDWTQWLFSRVASGQMTGGVLEYVQDTSQAYDQTVPPTAEGQSKPEVTNTFELKQVTPKTIAHWLSASKQILADAAALRSFLDGRLLYGLMRKLEYQVVNGPGTTTHMTGLMTAALDAGVAISGDNPFDTVRKAIGVVEASGWIVDTVGLHPTDWAAMQIIKGDDGHYVYFNPANSTGPAPIWGKQVVASPEIAAGKFLVGACSQGAQLFEREGASVQAGFQNDDFTRNLVTLLAEMRAVLAIYANAAFRKGNLY
jgi:HK97 family phage major capsid protein